MDPGFCRMNGNNVVVLFSDEFVAWRVFVGSCFMQSFHTFVGDPWVRMFLLDAAHFPSNTKAETILQGKVAQLIAWC